MSEKKIFPVNKDRLVKEFAELVEIDSVSFRERKMADVLIQKLEELGFSVREDDAAKKIGSDAGNLYAYRKGTLEGEPLLFSSHMDTVEPGSGKHAVLHDDGTITSEGDTVLGADDVAGLASILEAVRTLQENDIPHRSLEILFTVAEESYGKGSSVFDYDTISARQAYVLDISGPVGRASLQEPTLISFEISVKGKAAHAGFAPEEGVHAIAAAAAAITKIRQGRLDDETRVNIGKIEGGQATNIVPDLVTVKGEIRSYRHESALAQMEEIRRIFEETAKSFGAEAKVRDEVILQAYRVEEDEAVVQRFLRVCESLGLDGRLTKTFGGSDNNSFLRHDIRGIVLACGMNQVHSTIEYTSVEELALCASIVAGLMAEKS
ncbi:MAG: M20/M25/M40 family metallo-hydrolase [Eubacteriales bacterium]|nr:M20/M25/M40 family metallo-hydrolase [Eubacteriales bacterium]